MNGAGADLGGRYLTVALHLRLSMSQIILPGPREEGEKKLVALFHSFLKIQNILEEYISHSLTLDQCEKPQSVELCEENLHAVVIRIFNEVLGECYFVIYW